jgi:hypothetical protein
MKKARSLRKWGKTAFPGAPGLDWSCRQIFLTEALRPATGSQCDDSGTFDEPLWSPPVSRTTTQPDLSVSQTESPHQRTNRVQQHWPTAESDPYSDLFPGWFWAEVALLSSMKIVQTEKSVEARATNDRKVIS